MSEEKSKTQEESVDNVSEEPAGITQEEREHLANLTENKRVTQAAAERALLKNELAELQYKNFVLQVYIKYKLSMNDNISEDGTFLKENAEGSGQQ